MEEETNLIKRAPKQRKLVRLERNVDTLPIWAPRAYRKEDVRIYQVPWAGKDAYVKVQKGGEYGQLCPFDKFILIALVDIWNDQGRDPEGWISFQIIHIIEKLGRRDDPMGKLYKQIKASLKRLRHCGVEWHESFWDKAKDEWLSNPNPHILDDLWLIERKQKKGSKKVQLAFESFTRAKLDFSLVQSLLGHYVGRGYDLKLLQTLSERGVLFDAYINSVLYRNDYVKPDIFKLWERLGLSTKGIKYGSELASKMRPDLKMILSMPTSLLGRFRFSKSETNPKSKNVEMWRVKDWIHDEKPQQQPSQLPAEIPQPQEHGPPGHDAPRHGDAPPPSTPSGQTAPEIGLEAKVILVRERLQDRGNSDYNIRQVVQNMPWKLVEQGMFQAWGRFKDGQTDNPARYFVGIMKKMAKDKDINLGLPDNGSESQDSDPENSSQ